MDDKEVGWIYTLHFNHTIGDPTRPRCSARHYVGWAGLECLDKRIELHRKGQSRVPIMRYLFEQGIGFQVGRVIPGTRDQERRIKSSGHHDRCCEVCKMLSWLEGEKAPIESRQAIS